MQITPEEIYWLTRLDYFRYAAGGGLVITVILFFAILVGMEQDDDRYSQRCHWPILILWGIVNFMAMLACIAALVFVPTTKQMAMIKVGPAIVNSDFMQKDLPDDAKQIYELGKKAVVEYLEGKKE